MILLLIFAGLLACGLAASMAERRRWNCGICKNNGLPWVYFDTDSRGGRGYRAGERVTWISWPGIASAQSEQSSMRADANEGDAK